MRIVCDMQNTTRTWQSRSDQLGIRVPTIAKVTGYSVRSVRAYREGTRNPSADFLARVDNLLTSIELAGGTAA